MTVLIFGDTGGTLRLFPSIGTRDGPCVTLPELVTLSPTCVHAETGRTVLALWEDWQDTPPLPGPPERPFWSAVPGFRSYRSFQRNHHLVCFELREPPDCSAAYLPRKNDGYWAEPGDVLPKASFRVDRPQCPRQLGKAIRQIFQLAQCLDPLPPHAGGGVEHP